MFLSTVRILNSNTTEYGIALCDVIKLCICMVGFSDPVIVHYPLQ